jgi:hypothetical protein
MAKLSERVQERQARRVRQPLAPSHPRPATESKGSGEPQDQAAQVIDLSTAGGVEDTHQEPSTPAAPAPMTTVPVQPPTANRTQQGRRNKAKAAATEEVAVPLEPRQVWLDRQNDLWLSECEYANVRSGGRKVISRSSVVRLALDRLREAMTPEEITELLAGRESTQPSRRGRPRR